MPARKKTSSRPLNIETLEDRLPLAADFDSSAAAILQLFESTYGNAENRAADIFLAGYGGVWVPPTGRADSGNLSVGYDVFDRFDLGSSGNATLYGTQTGLKSVVEELHQAGQSVYVDFVLNHNGFRDSSTSNFLDEGGYPGFALTLTPENNGQGITDVDGDFHSAFDSGDLNGRLAGLIDIDQGKDHRFIRHPVDADNANNLPAGSHHNGADPNNAIFYPDLDLDPILVFDPSTGESDIAIYPFNTEDPLAGDAVEENALGLMMRNAQWLVQTVGVDGFRLDAAKHFETYVLEYFDRAVYRSIQEPNLDGSTRHVFSFSEVFEGDKAFQQTKIRKDINPAEPGRVGGNRDVLDFPLFFSMRDNLTNNGLANDWRNIRNASQDIQDDGLANNGSQGIAFVNNHDEHGPYLDNVAHAFVLMRPGNASVYFNAEQFGQERDFPKAGRGDALGGQYGEAITRLVNIRNSHGRGDYLDRTPSADEKEMLIFERSASSLTVLSNRMDGGFDSRTIQTNFAAGTPLIELTGNASDPTIDPFNDFPEVLIVAGDGTVNLRVPRNMSPAGVQHNSGYLIYGAAGPQGSLSLHDVDSTIAPETPNEQTNGTARLTPIDVITADQFNVQLDTLAVNHLGSIRDSFADGDNALIKIDQGIDLNATPGIDFTSGDLAGFETFTTFKQPGFFQSDGIGQYVQTIDTTDLSEGTHFLEIRAFRHREPGEGPEIYSPFRKVFYVDRLDPESAIESFHPITLGVNENRELIIRSLDQTANNIHVLFDLPAATSDAEIIEMLDQTNQTTQIDRDLFSQSHNGLTHGNHVATVVSFELSGNVNIQRFSGLFTSTIFGAGLGDLDHDGDLDADDIAEFEIILQSANTQFNAAGDFDADGDHDLYDLSLFHQVLLNNGADQTTLTAFDNLVENNATLDLGDAPDPLVSSSDQYPTRMIDNGARHLLKVGPFLGASVDNELDGQPDSICLGDDNHELDDEDGVTLPEFITQGKTSTLEINASGAGLLNAFLDINADGDWNDSGEHFAVDIPLVAGDNSILMSVPETATPGITVSRFRFDTFGSLTATGLASNGEVEDYQIEILAQADFGDAPLPYPVTLIENGPRHVAIGPTLGAARDRELDGVHSVNADADGPDDDGVTFQSLLRGQTTLVDVTVSAAEGLLDGWVDFNGDGDWLDSGEQVFASLPLEMGLNQLMFEVPSGASEGATFSRFRLSTEGGLSPTGNANSGEIEDYRNTIYTNSAPTLDRPTDSNIEEDAAAQTVNLSGITDGGEGEQPLSVIATSSHPGLIPNPVVTYNSPDETGTLEFTPAANQSGTATITVLVEDGGLDQDLSTQGDNATYQETFLVTVHPVNDDPPTLDPIPDFSLEEDAPETAVNLSGIGDGDLGVQPLEVTAISSNMDLIPTPTIEYTSPDAVGILKFTPTRNSSGTATITVTVEDGGEDNDLNTKLDNATKTTTFEVNVAAVNDPPTLTAPTDLDFNESVTGYLVDLTDISSGDGEDQLLSLTVTTDNSEFLQDFSVDYSTGSNGTLIFTTAAGELGRGTIFVRLEDGGLDNNLETTADNASVTRAIDVSVTAKKRVFAHTDHTVFGEIQGTYRDTYWKNQYSQTIQETLFRGQQRSRLEHHWKFDAPGADVSLDFFVTTSHDATNEQFRFQYQIQGSDQWKNLVTTSHNGSRNYFARVVDPDLATDSHITVRVTDTLRSNESERATLQVDRIYFTARRLNSLEDSVNVLVFDPEGSEGGGDKAQLRFQLADRVRLDRDIEVFYELSGTAVNSDYREVLRGSKIIKAGNLMTRLFVTPKSDSAFEGLESVTVRLLESEAFRLTGDPVATVTIKDQDLVTFESFREVSLSGQHDLNYPQSFILDDQWEMITEEMYANGNRGRMDQRWKFDLTGETSVVFKGRFKVTSEPDLDDFQLVYSTDGTSWKSLGRVTHQQGVIDLIRPIELPAGTTDVWVRMFDRHRKNGDTLPSVVSVDLLRFERSVFQMPTARMPLSTRDDSAWPTEDSSPVSLANQPNSRPSGRLWRLESGHDHPLWLVPDETALDELDSLYETWHAEALQSFGFADWLHQHLLERS